eukprot:12271059-Prorocentrum_lima.AAC.1
MPLDNRSRRGVQDHNERIPHHLPSFNPMLDMVYADNIDDALKDECTGNQHNAAVARTCSLKEADKNPKARAALDKEWERLKSINTWDESTVREWRDVAKDARFKGEGAHVGRVFAILVEKNHA